MALELVLRSFLNSKKFVNSSADEKDWQAIAKLIPGVSAKQCAKKWEELTQQEGVFISNDGRLVLDNDDKTVPGLNDAIECLLLSKDSDLDNSTAEDVKFDDDDDELSNVNSDDSVNSKDHHSKTLKSEDGNEQKKDPLSSSTKKTKAKAVSPDGPNMVIHVCDESKNLKQDFSCQRDLLVKEMKYFAEYLSLEPQRWEEVDISVHCDVQIFDWLIRYAKRDVTNNEESVPKLDVGNVISILISSDFLRMDSLVSKCIHFCHEHMSTILSTPCNMNCINDKLLTRIAKLFTHTELDCIKDKKDKFKSKLFCKKIEEFVESSVSSENASTLFRCNSCKKLLTADNKSKIPCVLNRMHLDSRGNMSFHHIRDVTWDINDYLLNLKDRLRSWKDVYWRLWGSVVTLYCYQCCRYFLGTELGHCRYHAHGIEYNEEPDTTTTLVGIYSCCQQKVLRYDSIGHTSGCKTRDHVWTAAKIPKNKIIVDKAFVDNEVMDSKSDNSLLPADEIKSSKIINDPVVIKDLLAHRDIICVPCQRVVSARLFQDDSQHVLLAENVVLIGLFCRNSELNVFEEDESFDSSKLPSNYAKTHALNPSERKSGNESATTAFPPIRRSKTSISQRMPSSRRKTAILKIGVTSSTEEEEDSGDDEEEESHAHKGTTRHFQRAKKKHSADNRQSSGFKWDPQRSQRWNQDAQREEDSKRMAEVINAMAKLRSASSQEKKTKSKEFPGGIFHKLDHQFKVATQPPNMKQTSSGQLTTGSRSRRPVVKS